MLLAIDIGNTSVKTGLFTGRAENPAWKKAFRWETGPDEPAFNFLREERWPEGIQEVVVASVVPNLNRLLAEALHAALGVKPRVLTGREIPLRIITDNPAEVGIDRLLNGLAAGRLYGKPAVVVDCGTALTFDLVNPTGDYEGGLIAPSPDIAGAALAEKTALLPRVNLKTIPVSLVGKNTEQAMQSGIIIGFAELISGLLNRLEREWNPRYVTVGTGGGLEAILPFLTRKIVWDPDLTLKGIRLAAGG